MDWESLAGESLVGNKGYRRYLGAARGGHFEIDEKRIKQEARHDGINDLRYTSKKSTFFHILGLTTWFFGFQ